MIIIDTWTLLFHNMICFWFSGGLVHERSFDGMEDISGYKSQHAVSAYLHGQYRPLDTLENNSIHFHESQEKTSSLTHTEGTNENPLQQIKSEYSGSCQSLPPMSSLTQRMLKFCTNRSEENVNNNTELNGSASSEPGYGSGLDCSQGYLNVNPTYTSWNQPGFEKALGSRLEFAENGTPQNWHRAPTEVDQESVKLKCTICTRSFSSIGQYTVHMKKHETNNKYHCPKCNQSYFCLGSVRRHMQVCCSGNTLTCPICEKQFQYPETLKDHLRGKHLIGDMYKCGCGKEFRWRETFSKHKKQCPANNFR